MKPEDKAILDKVFAHQDGAFEELLDRFRPLFFSVFHDPLFSFRYDDMDDLYQSLVVALSKDDYRKLRAFEGRNNCSLATFLQIVTTRFGLDERRRQRRHPRGYGRANRDDEPEMEVEDPTAPQPHERLLDKEQVAIFHNILFSLDWKRVSAVLWVFRGVTRERIAEVMSTSRANIDALYKRAKDQMVGLREQGAGASRKREADPEVLVPPIKERLATLARRPTPDIHRALLVPGAKRLALLGMVLAEYPRFLCSKAEIGRIAGSKEPLPLCLEALDMALSGSDR